MNLDRDALSKLWDETTPKLFGYLVNVTRDKSLAEDLLQSTWLKAIEAMPKFKSRGAGFPAWLFAIARNECRQAWRKSNREAAFDLEQHDKAAPDNNSENQILVDQLLSNLSEDDRELIRLRYIADLPINDIARILNLNFVTVRVRLHRALVQAKSYAAKHS
ncbi:MAG: hypothetical protein A2751_02245 [Candidatus Doudnabacteria bacterium RIFCSPHIGHO2_01_FULL_46_14]|uniref:RNA polymerase sigma factor n=1 Tax=Candidatus Doudnabacteria bacterium RIFCSPHIGHO2_01_FULL_46_14 TaxID=1817824 RepID=A0A1F5NJX1_9BACT|nr:MAG: hypothetical protein A2751_02245 [Candidatus Doudnabacteria bacterium RIFCSPHIGHO2_01_FULL_46_14]